MLFREGLLSGRAVALAGDAGPRIRASLTSLGARVEVLHGTLDDDGAERWAHVCAPLDALVYDARETFDSGGLVALRLTIDRAWSAVRAVAVGAMIPAEGSGKVILLGPRPDAGPHAEAARAALENLARTLSIEWARYSITATAIAPGTSTTDDQLATLACFVASPAGDYLSGCCLRLGTVPAARQ